jgi:glutathione S-transferase
MYKLYNVKAWGSISIHCVLEEMEVPYTNIWMTPEQVRDPDFRTTSPLGMIPALGLSDGRSLYESAAIVTFLLAAHPDKDMAPTQGSADFGEFMSMLHLMSTELYPTGNLAIPGNAYALDESHDAFIVSAAATMADQYWSLLEARLAKSGPWLMGHRFSALDPYAFMLSLWGRPSETALHQRFPHVAKLASELRARPKLKAVLEAHGVLEPGGYAG